MAPFPFAATAAMGLRDTWALNATFRLPPSAVVGADRRWKRMPIEHLAVYRELTPGNQPLG